MVSNHACYWDHCYLDYFITFLTFMKNQHGTPQYRMFDNVKKGFPNYNAWKFCVANFIQRNELLI